ncbi:peptidoglycan editing factor PgeF [Oerskovia flava]|uniref:peptidoglycan editing factor PgeF n=1 Tax=Oerskovia flava TaxID=2986422 RepID=UPI00223EC1DB|nr:peptidoglycan editing factor PgeF [Oerskovia sp. JB1-3-2]
MPPLPVLTVDLGRGVRAGFTGREGGESPSPWASLNLGLGVHDDAARVVRNRARVSAWLGAPTTYATQVHGADVLRVDGPAPAGEHTCGEGDALVTTVSGVGLGVLVADCVPVLLADPFARVVGVAHAGRRGVHSGVVLRALEAMVALGASPSRVRAVVGPCACGRCYEVPDAMRAEVATRRPATWSTTERGTPALDLPAGVAADLRDAGASVTLLDVCTITDERYFSHRRASRGGTTTGRFAGVIALEAPAER